MKYSKTTYTFILALILAGNLRAQSDADGPSIPSLPGMINEKIELFTNRTIYATGDKIQFSTFLFNPTGQAPNCWSRVIYLDLVTPDGNSVSRGKYPSSCYNSQGDLLIPDQLLTGNYYLVSYTRWMQNYSPLHYTYKLIKIINPFTSQLEPSCLQEGTGATIVREVEQRTTDEVILLTPERSSYRAGEQIKLSVGLQDSEQPLTSRFTVMAGRPAVMDSLNQTLILPDSINFRTSGSIRYLPELMGLSISGKVFLAGSTEPAGNILVELSILGVDPRFLSCLTEEDGSFCFALDSMTGSRELIIAARDPDEKNLEVRVDNDFANTNFAFAPRPFVLTDSERGEAARIMLNMQIRNSYQSNSSEPPITPDKGNFYGKPSGRILIDEYIELPNLKEVVIELIPEVHYRVQDPKAPLRFAGNDITQGIIANFEPLILMDQVPIYDLVNLVDQSPRDLFSIEVVNEIYVTGNNMYGGIMNITSKKGDLAGIDLPANSFFFDFTTFQPRSSAAYGQVVDGEEKDPLPDLRNSLYWEPGLELVPGQTREVSFTAPDRPGRFLVMIKGLAADGSILQGRCTIMVD